MKILIINAGSSSLKYQLIQMQPENTTQQNCTNASHTIMAAGVIERIGEPLGKLTHKRFIKHAWPDATSAPPDHENNEAYFHGKRSWPDAIPATPEDENRGCFHGKENVLSNPPKQFIREKKIKDHGDALHLAVQMITAPDTGVIQNKDNIEAIGHRVVQGGERFNASIRIDDRVKKAIEEYIPLAPLHNPPNLTGIEVAEKLFPGTPNVAVFDTEFHQSIPPKAYMYALPYEFYEKYRVRRYGFHGTSHKYIAATAAELMQRESHGKKAFNLITVHLGNGCSICAVKQGKCVDTSMGMTPLAGVMMGTRTGDMDPAIQKYLLDYTDFTPDTLDDVFNKQSGLKGICGLNDLRDIHEAIDRGDEKAVLALEMFTYQIKKYIGAYAAVLGEVDGVIFTAGIGENDDRVRAEVCRGLSGMGMVLDPEKNRGRISENKAIHAEKSAVAIWVIPTNEELQIAREVLSVLS